MPELPEVETIRRQLLPHLPAIIKKRKYSNVAQSVLKTEMFSPVGKTIKTISRKGKLLDFVFDDGSHMLSGLGMSGGWRVSQKPVTEKHTHIQFTCDNSEGRVYFAYVDPRRFGKCHLVDAPTAQQMLARLGVDISSKLFTAAYVARICQKYPHREIKPFLLDQAYFAGVGNYIACEVLAHSGIHPARPAGSLSNDEHHRLVTAVRLVLSGSLKQNGLTFSGGYTDATGQKGQALNTLVVFHQKRCGLCNQTPVEKFSLKGRTTFYCPLCQT
ncbi:MAG: Fpg/Nei family DNA glycosylase [Deltaproteobacteria bacterium]|nr:Fpg/Nei family DNA glycosylase [Deltaproteobacteria bacterium]